MSEDKGSYPQIWSYNYVAHCIYFAILINLLIFFIIDACWTVKFITNLK